MSGGGGQTVTTQSGPPANFLAAYDYVLDQAKRVAATPYESYPGSVVAPLSPDQNRAIELVQNAQGISAPYINTASQYFDASTDNLLNGVPQMGTERLGGLADQGLNYIASSARPMVSGVAGLGASGIMDAARSFTPGSVAPWMSPYTQEVVDATQRQFNLSNAQQQQDVIGNAISRGAWGGDRSAVAQAILAGQQQAQQAPVIAGLYDRGYQTGQGAALNAAQLGLQGATSAGQLGLQGATQQAGLESDAARQLLGFYGGQQGVGLGANQAAAQLAQGAGYGMAGLGREALASTLTGAQALAGMGALEQEQAQRLLNVPYQQYTAAQQYPFQTTGWLSGIASGLGGSAGGTSSQTQPGPSPLSQAAGLGLGALSLIGGTGGFGDGGWLTNWFRSAGGEVPDGYASGGSIQDDDFVLDGVPDVSISIIPPLRAKGGKPAILSSTGSTTTTSGSSGLGGFLGSIAGLAKFLPLVLADGGDVPLMTSIAGRRAGISVPMLSFGRHTAGQMQGLGGAAILPEEAKMLRAAAESSAPGVGDYLSSVLGGASWARPSVYTPPPIADAPPAVSSPADPMPPIHQWSPAESGTDFGGADFGGGFGSDFGGVENSDADNSGSGGGNPGGEMGYGRGGDVHGYDEGGDVAEDEPARGRLGFMSPGNPWNALLYAGLGAMAGTSPNALTNIGSGALAGVDRYMKERRDQDVSDVRRARIEALERWRNAQAEIARRRADLQEQRDAAYIGKQEAQTAALVAGLNRAAGAGGGGAASYEAFPAQMEVDGKIVPGMNVFNKRSGQLEFRPAGAAASIVNQQSRREMGAQTEEGKNQRAADALAARRDIAELNAAIRREIDARKGADNKAWRDDKRSQAIGRLAVNDMIANPGKTLNQAMDDAITAHDQIPSPSRGSGAALSPFKPGGASLPLPRSASDLVAGKTYETARGAAVWDGKVFVPVPR